MRIIHDGIPRVMQLPDGRWQAGLGIVYPGDDQHVPCTWATATTGKTRAKAIKALLKSCEVSMTFYEGEE